MDTAAESDPAAELDPATEETEDLEADAKNKDRKGAMRMIQVQKFQ